MLHLLQPNKFPLWVQRISLKLMGGKNRSREENNWTLAVAVDAVNVYKWLYQAWGSVIPLKCFFLIDDFNVKTLFSKKIVLAFKDGRQSCQIWTKRRRKKTSAMWHLTSGSSGKMLSTSLLYRGLSAPQQPQTPEREGEMEREGIRGTERARERDRQEQEEWVGRFWWCCFIGQKDKSMSQKLQVNIPKHYLCTRRIVQ